MCIFIYIFGKNIFIYIIAKVKFPKIYTIGYALYIPEFYYFLYIILKLYMLKNDSKLYFWESICYMIYDWYWQYCNKVRMFSNGQLDSLHLLPTQGSVLVFGRYSVIVVWYSVIVCSSEPVLLFAPWSQCYCLLLGANVASLRLVLLFPMEITHRVLSNLCLVWLIFNVFHIKLLFYYDRPL